MRFVALLLMMAATLAACGDDGAPRPGTYVFDRETYRRDAIERRRLAHGSDADALLGSARRALEARWRQEADAEAAAIRLRLDLSADGRFHVVYRYGDEQGDARGGWSYETGRLRLRTEEEGGRPLAEPSETEGTVDGDAVRLAGLRAPIPIPLRRAPAAGGG